MYEGEENTHVGKSNVTCNFVKADSTVVEFDKT